MWSYKGILGGFTRKLNEVKCEKKFVIAIMGDGFHRWNGGIDFFIKMVKGLDYYREKYGTIDLFIFLKKDCCITKVAKKLNNIRRKCSGKTVLSYSNLLKRLSEEIPDVKIVYYRYSRILPKNIRDRWLEQCAKSYGIDLCFAKAGEPLHNIKLPWIGYVPDLQFKYLTENFSHREIEIRDSAVRRMLKEAHGVVVNAQEVRLDIQRCYPEYDVKILVLPYYLGINKEWLQDKKYLIKPYNLPQRYFVISNQFWKHKSHITAFRAMRLLKQEGHDDVYLVCTGKLQDSRDEMYIRRLQEYIKKYQLNICFLGQIPKRVQIEIIKNSVAMIQPTLFEGGPGGGAVQDALAVGTRCIVSDIDVNLEIKNEQGVIFFKKENSEDLKEKMLTILQTKKIECNEESIRKRGILSLDNYAKQLVSTLRQYCKK